MGEITGAFFPRRALAAISDHHAFKKLPLRPAEATHTNSVSQPIYHLRVFQPALISRTARMMQARTQRTANVLNNHPASNQTATSLSMPNISLARSAID
jgi:hypothetical protein